MRGIPFSLKQLARETLPVIVAATALLCASCTALGIQDQMLTLTIIQGTHGSASPSGTATVLSGAKTTIHAVPDPGYSFSQWVVTSGKASFGDSSAATTTVWLELSDASVEPTFVALPSVHKLSVVVIVGGIPSPDIVLDAPDGQAVSVKVIIPANHDFISAQVSPSGNAAISGEAHDSSSWSAQVTVSGGDATVTVSLK